MAKGFPALSSSPTSCRLLARGQNPIPLAEFIFLPVPKSCNTLSWDVLHQLI